jgi:hypothetical protein
MRTTFLAIFLAFVAKFATADVIDNVVANLPDAWNDNQAGLTIMPKSASTEDVLQRVFQNVSVFEIGQITNFTVLETRQVSIPWCHFPNAPVYSYTAVLVQPSRGDKVVVVLLRYLDVDTSRAWSSAFFEANVTDTWKKIENDSFSFSVPPSFKQTATHGIDSFVEEYVSDDIDLDFDYGAYSNDFRDWPKDTNFENLKIDGEVARIGTVAHEFHKGFPYSTQVHFKFGTLSMFAACKSEKDVALARKIFETIAFKAETP